MYHPVPPAFFIYKSLYHPHVLILTVAANREGLVVFRPGTGLVGQWWALPRALPRVFSARYSEHTDKLTHSWQLQQIDARVP